MRKLSFLIIVCMIAGNLFAQEREQRLQSQLNLLTKELDSSFYGIAFKDLQTNETFFLNEHTSFHAASTMKTPVMIEVFRQVKAKKMALDDSVLVTNHFKSIVDGSDFTLSAGDDSDSLVYSLIGKKASVYDLLFQMITMSSNMATNILIEKVGPQNVMKTMRRMHANDIRVLRGVEDGKAFEKGLNNTATAYDLMLLMEAIAKEKAVSRKASRQMTQILLQQHYNDQIPALLPADVKVAHKTGWITGIRHDSGFVILPDGRRYVLVILTRFPQDQDEADKAVMQKISRAFYDYVVQ